MKRASGRGAAIIAATVAVLALVLSGSASASTAGPAAAVTPTHGNPAWFKGDCKGGEAIGNGTFIAAMFKFSVCANSADNHDVSGYFQAFANFGGSALIAPEGPVTCAAFRGDEVSFLYPLVGDKPPFPPNSTSILIYAKNGGPGQGKVGFAGPAPSALFMNRCDFAAPFTIQAQAVATPVLQGSVKVVGPKA